MSKNKSQKVNVVVLGEEGSGKSTLINLWANLFLKGRLVVPPNGIVEKYTHMLLQLKTDIKVVIPNSLSEVTEADFASKGLTKFDTTLTTCSYTFNYEHEGNNFGVMLIDTPKLRKPEANDSNVSEVAKALIKLKNIAAIVLVINGSELRSIENARLILAKLRTFLPAVHLENVVAVFTRVNEISASLATLGIKEDHMFPLKTKVFGCDIGQASKNDKAIRDLKDSWDRSMDTLEVMTRLILLGNEKSSTRVFSRMKSVLEEMQTNRQQIVDIINQLMQAEMSRAEHQQEKDDLETELQDYDDMKPQFQSQGQLPPQIESIKVKYDALTSRLDAVTKEISAETDLITALCKDFNAREEKLKSLLDDMNDICPEFNVADELHSVIGDLLKKRKSYNNFDGPTEADIKITKLQAIVNELPHSASK